MSFKADFTVDNDQVHANQKIFFKSDPQVGLLVDDNFLQIDGDVSKGDLDLSSFVVTQISKIQWIFSDGNFYNSNEVVHKFIESKKETVTLKIWSESFSFQGKTFYFTHSITKDILVESRFYKFIKDKYPIYDEVSSVELDDLIKSAGKFFDRLHADTSGLSDFIDIHRISPEYLEYWALTLGHSQYVRKVGYKLASNDLDNYDIFDKINLNNATNAEIETLRSFLLYSADLFRNKGTPENIRNFLKFFDIDAKTKDLWTKTWEVSLKSQQEDSFVGYESFVDNKLGFKWNNINVANITNEDNHLEKTFNSIILNSYNYCQKIEYPYNSVNTISVSGDKFGWQEFELSSPNGISASPSYIKQILKENGERIVNIEVVDESQCIDIVPNDPVRKNLGVFSILQVNPNILSSGETLNVLYDVPSDDKKECIISTIDKTLKDFDLRVTFKLKQENTKTNLYRAPDNELFVSFRGTKASGGTNTDFDDFYRFSVNTDRKTFSLSKIIYSDTINDYLTQNISLSYSNDDIFEPVIAYPETYSISANELFTFEKEKEYELLLIVSGTNLSSYIREKFYENEMKSDIFDFKGNDNIKGIKQEIDWIPLIENFSFNVQPKKVKTIDSLGNELYSESYQVTQTVGTYGVGVKDGIIEFTNIIVSPLDVDDKLYNKLEKELELKPLYLENTVYEDTRMDNYENTKKDFVKTISNEFNTNTTYNVSTEESSSIDTIFIDKAPITQTFGTRYVVDFNNDWVLNNFSSDADLVSKIIIPIGSQHAWFLPEQRVLNSKNYSSYNLSSGGPGFFSADLLPVLGTYNLEPLDSFSSTDRTNLDSNVITYNRKLQQYINYNSDGFAFDGVWEEVYPYSNVFESISSDITLDDSSKFVNKMFVPITVDIPEGTRVIGVKFRSCDYIKSLISRYSTEFNKEVTIWGSFTLHLPCNTTLYKPSQYNLEDSDKFPGHYKIKIFTPLGILDESIMNYSLGREFAQQSNNTPSLIELNGIYAKLIPDKLTIGTSQVIINTLNPFESVDKGLQVNYFISGNLDLSTTLVKPTSTNTDERNNIFTFDLKTREFFDSLSTSGDFKWWLPTDAWRKRSFEIQEANLEEDIVSGINYSPKSVDENNNSKIFFGKEIPTSSDSIRSLSIKLTDGSITPNTLYYAKFKIKINYSGFSYSVISNLSESDKQRIKVAGVNITKDFEMAPVKVCKEIYVPISWYDINELLIANPNYDKCSSNPAISASVVLSDTLEYANFIRRSFAGDETITFTPMGLMTEGINYKPVSNINVLLNIDEVAQYVSESTWNHNNWNKYFIENIEITDVIEKIPSAHYEFFNKYVILSDNKLNIGSNLEFIYNSAELDWNVLQNFSYFVTNYTNKNLSFDIPYELKDIYNWNKNIKDIVINRYVVDRSLYTIGEGKITIGTSSILEQLKGGQLKGKFDFDFYFDREKTYKTTKDDFNLTREINWIPYEANSSEIYENMKRIPSKNLLLGLSDSNKNSYDIIVKDNIYSFRSLNKNSIYPSEGRQSGTRVNNRNISITQNEPNARRIYMIDNDNYIFDIQADVYFDSKLNEIKNYRGKKFELILKANETFYPEISKNILGSYYFAGIGSYDFDIALGVSKFNSDTSKNESSFLAGFGDYNTKNIKSNVWYRIRCIVTNDYIRVIFHPKDEPERLVLNYFINEKYQTDTSRYLSGNFEELVYNITGLDKLNIIYPDKVGENTNEKFVRKYLNDQLIPVARPFGSLCGFRIFNEYTYMANIQYKYLSEDGYQVGNAFNIENLSDIILDINKKY